MSIPGEHRQVNTERLARLILEAAARGGSEEDLKMAMEQLLQAAMRQLGLDPSGVRYEKSSATYAGRRDCVYGYVTIEYKKPRKFDTPGAANDAAGQLQKYLADDAEKHQPHQEDYLEKAVGVATDGRTILFVRFSKSATPMQLPFADDLPVQQLFPDAVVRRGFQVLGPYPVNAASIASLLVYLRAAERLPLTAPNLAGVFAPPQDVACQAVSELYASAMRAQRQQGPSRVRTFYKEWERIFGVVYGEELAKAEKAANMTAELYHMPGGVRLPTLLFSIHTYYALLMKLIALELVALQRGSNLTSFVAGLDALESDDLRDRLSQMESGLEFQERGITNFLEADFFSWYLDAWDDVLVKAVRGLIQGLARFEPATPVLEPEWTRDLLQNLYEDVVPKDLRHALGEYYTPDWLAGYLIDRTGYKGSIGTRFLDPACGSGTFLVQAIGRAVKANRLKTAEQVRRVGEHILANVVGFDLNPLAVLAARTNYLIAFARFMPHVRPIVLPVYLCDSVRAPSRYVEEGELDYSDRLVFTTTKADYEFPLAMQNREMIDRFTGMVDTAMRGTGKERVRLTVERFTTRLEHEFKLREPETEMLANVYKTIRQLDVDGENGIWARYIKNAFAPVFLDKFDFVIGNPPWIRWGYLSAEYRRKTLKMWHKYGLFSLKGHETRLGAGEKDFSMLFTYACADNYLKDGGRLGFLVTMEAFKSKGAGEGFRGFELRDKRVPLKMLWMDDMVNLMPFRAANKTSLFALQKGKRTRYPVKVTSWARKPGTGPIPQNWSLEQVLAHTTRVRMRARPVDGNKPVSSWQTGTVAGLATAAALRGRSVYKPWIGARIEPYGVYWVRVKEVRPDGRIVIENLSTKGKTEVRRTSLALEPDFVYPTVSGRELSKFGTRGSFYAIVVQDPESREGVAEDKLLSAAPLTHAYLSGFERTLRRRAAFRKYYCEAIRERDGRVQFKPLAPFYSQYNIGTWTFARYRVTWKRMASRIEAAVLSSVRTPLGTKPLISTDTTSFIALDDKQEAHYLCALLNSDIVDSYVRSFSSAGRGFGAPSVMANVAIPKFDPQNKLHARLAELSLQAHKLVKAGKTVDDIQQEIDAAARKLWNIKS
ncbi:hypothetical protein FJY70_00360 [candidate division WOR-3 bacterium]|nr:hypothetical protein [candidate division WOR-3 bacterium]